VVSDAQWDQHSVVIARPKVTSTLQDKDKTVPVKSSGPLSRYIKDSSNYCPHVWQHNLNSYFYAKRLNFISA